MVRANSHYVPSVADPLSPITFVHKIKVPTYMACQFTDEQTGGHCTDLAEHFTGTRHKWFTFTNGVHADSLDPATFNRWYDFLELYVARRNPTVSASAQALAPTLYATALGVNGVTLPDDPIQHEPSYAAALAAFQGLPSIRVLFDNGAGSANAGLAGAGIRALVLALPGAGHAGPLVVPGPVRDAGRRPARQGRPGVVHMATRRVPATDFSG